MDHPHRGQPPTALQAKQPPPAAPPPRRPGHRHRRVIDRLADRFLAQPAPRLIDEHLPQLVRDLLRAPAPGEQARDGPGQHGVAGDPPPARLARPRASDVLGVVGAIPAAMVAVAADLAADRRRRPSELARDPTHAHARRAQVSDPDPLGLRQVPRTPRPRLHDFHRGIVQALPDGIDDRAPIAPPRARLAVDPDQPTRLRVAHPLRDQAHEPLLPLRLDPAPSRPSTISHPNLHTSPVLRR